MTTISIPDPSLVVLIGAAGAGKSTFAARHFDPTEVLSSDAYRALIAGDEADQTVSRAAFGRLHRDLGRRLRDGRLTVVDATNVERTARQALIAHARAANLPAVAVVLDFSAEFVLARNAARSARVVDGAAVQHHIDRLRATLDRPGTDLAFEGFRDVYVFRDASELERVRIERIAT